MRYSLNAVWAAARRIGAGLALAIAYACAVCAAQQPATDPAEPLARLHAGLLAAGAAGWPPERAVVARLVAESFDLPLIARTVLGARDAGATDAQRQRLADLLGRRMVRELMRRKPSGAADLQILGVRAIDRGEWLVASRVSMPGGEAAIFQWRVHARPQGLRIVDGMREGASAVITMRHEIAEALRRRSLDDVIDELERRDAEAVR